jgi:hypothetical protein
LCRNHIPLGRFFHVYKTFIYPFNPILVDIEQFELDICSYLNAYAAGELQDPHGTSSRWASEESVSLISLILAVLSSGAHFSDMESPERTKICHDLGVLL